MLIEQPARCKHASKPTHNSGMVTSPRAALSLLLMQKELQTLPYCPISHPRDDSLIMAGTIALTPSHPCVHNYIHTTTLYLPL